MLIRPEPWPLVAAIVPVRNRRAITLRFLDQITHQSYPALRVVVVDSNSIDGTSDAIRKAHPTVTVLTAGDSDFWAGATNMGVRHALALGSEWIFTINDDAMISPDHVERLLDLAYRNNCHILGSQINHLNDPELIWSLGTFTRWGGQDFLRLGYHGRHNNERDAGILSAERLEVDALPGNGVLIHRSVFQRIGLYNDIMLPHYHADSELIMRAAARGIKAWVSPQLILLNDFSKNQKQLPLDSLRGLLWSLWNPKSYTYLPALLYIWLRFCPCNCKVASSILLVKRFLQLASNKAHGARG